MPFSLQLRKNRIANIILNDHSIRYVELKQFHPPTAQRWGERFLPPGIISDGKITDLDALENILDECIEDWKLHKRQVRFLVPDSLVIIRKVAIPADVEEDEYRSYLYLELGSSIHLPFEDPVFDIFPLSTEGQQKEILLFASPEKYVMEYADLFSSLKMNPIAADISPLSVYRLYHSLDNARNGERLFLVQFSLTQVTMSIFADHIPQFMRHFPLELDWEKWSIQMDSEETNSHKYNGDIEVLKLQLEEIFREMTKLMDYYRYSLHNGKEEVTKILLTGDHPMLDLIIEEVNNRYEIPVQTLAAESLSTNRTKSLPSSQLLGLGLALKGVE
ncbi:type IV pilus biogenesis protein PilM [Neobacillus terrae]|uniref:type IV pilus biogenesis protein PilM n=1 Tax=Neobacillus terrae TaxID=3034837 RepID=UPI00140B6CD8|nr:pilus assembly protein PilM [Neobacillus terrae]NHM30478.1 pilus assembly protein PilM [Neobacillus terrae]